MADPIRRLYRSRTNRVLGGVCGGIAEYLKIDPVLVRIVMLLLTIMGGVGVLLYLVALFVMPIDPSGEREGATSTPTTAAMVVGIGLIVLGGLILLDNLDVLSFHRFCHYGEDLFFPAVLVLAGLYLITRKRRPVVTPPPPPPATDGTTPPPPSVPPSPDAQRRLTRSLTERKLLGVCGGIAEYAGMDPSVVRLIYIAFTFFSAGAGILMYLILALVLPEDQPRSAA